MNLYFVDFPALKTSRLLLRQLENHDAEQIHKLRSDPAVNAYIGRSISTGVEEAAGFIKKITASIEHKQSMYWAISLREDAHLIGTICYWNFDVENDTVEIGYEMLPEFQGRGLMTEAIKRVIEYGFEEMKVKTITAFPSADNTGSVALLKNAGFKVTDKAYANSHQNVSDQVAYALTCPEVPAAHGV